MLLMLLGVATAAPAQISIGINFSLFPELVQVPNYPVYYAPRQNANYFFYDGMYWVYQNDEWYSSDWYNGPWWRMAPEYVPVYVLRVPVRYYRRPPAYFHGWGRDAPPRWGEHWGRDWEQRRSGWDKWDHRTAPRPAPLPTYQRQYTGNQYPRVEEQHDLHDQKYRYQPTDALVREHVQPQMRGASAPAPREGQAEQPRRDAGKDARERDQRPGVSNAPAQKSEPAGRDKAPEKAREKEQRPEPKSAPQREQPAPKPAAQQQRPEPKAAPQREPAGDSNKGRDKGPDKARDKGDERGRNSNKKD
jgi:hypothetical protein